MSGRGDDLLGRRFLSLRVGEHGRMLGGQDFGVEFVLGVRDGIRESGGAEILRINRGPGRLPVDVLREDFPRRARGLAMDGDLRRRRTVVVVVARGWAAVAVGRLAVLLSLGGLSVAFDDEAVAEEAVLAGVLLRKLGEGAEGVVATRDDLRHLGEELDEVLVAWVDVGTLGVPVEDEELRFQRVSNILLYGALGKQCRNDERLLTRANVRMAS